MPTDALSLRSAHRAFYLLQVTRWFPSGLVAGIFVLWALQVGLSLGQALTTIAAIGVTVALLELPTSGFTDVFGRRPVYLAAAFVHMCAAFAYLLAQNVTGFMVAAILMGIFRALDSGPLEAWFVDAVKARDPAADVDQQLSRAGVLVGSSMAIGALVSGGLVLWHPIASRPALELPVAVFAVLSIVHFVAIWIVMREVPHLHVDAEIPELVEAVEGGAALSTRQRLWASVRATPTVVRTGLGLVARSAVLRGLMVAEIFWSIGMIVQESLVPVRLAEITGSLARSGELMGPTTAAGWGAFAAGSALVGWLSPRLGLANTAIIGRIAHGCAAIAAGLVAGPAALIGVFVLGYGAHGFGPAHMALIHREAPSSYRATILSVNGLVGFAAFAVGTAALGWLAEATSTTTAMVTAGAVSLIGVWGYLAARRAEGGR
ncbi:MFS transporter [Janibacter sp. GXQ6167]|uniref:MFS transporter n=1 Tax=Janibacter sp. GXQ6167 TaxID=3240791 RepID=UPI003525BD36